MEKRRHTWHLGLCFGALLCISIVLVVSTVAWFPQDNVASSRSPQSARLSAALVDELSIDSPDPSFVNATASLLVSAGYAVDYYGPSQVTVALFRDLPLRGYSLLILRAHTAGYNIVTGEQYSSNSYVWDQLGDRIVEADLGQKYFAVAPQFVSEDTNGVFPNSTVIMMGCGSLAGYEMAQAFANRGAAHYIGWTETVTADRTDTATLALVRSLVDGKNATEAVTSAMNIVGYDSVNHSQLGDISLPAYISVTNSPLSQQTSPSITGLSVLAGLLALMVIGPATVVLASRLFSKL